MSPRHATHHSTVLAARDFPATIDEFNEEVAGTIRGAVANDRAPAKKLARIVDKSHRTTEKWMTGRHVPHAFHLLKMAREIPALKALLSRFRDYEQRLDPKTERALMDLTRALAEQIGRESP